MARSREWDLPFPGQLAAISATHNVNRALGTDMGTEPAPFPRPVTVPQVWLSTSDGHLPDCPKFVVVGKH